MDDTSGAIDPDLAIEPGEFEEFAEFIVEAVLGTDLAAATVAEGAAAGAETEGAEVTGEGSVIAGEGSVISGEGGDALYTMPDGSISFSGTSGFGDTYSFDAG